MPIIIKNGKTITIGGSVIANKHIGTMVINGGKITVDGKPLSELDAVQDEKVINITIQGDVERLEVDYRVGYWHDGLKKWCNVPQYAVITHWSHLPQKPQNRDDCV